MLPVFPAVTAMPKKKKTQYTAPVMTRGQLSRAQRERQQLRNLYTAIFSVVTLVVLIIAFAAFTQLVLRPNQQVASVGLAGTTTNINRATYNKVRRWNLWQEAQSNALFNQAQPGLSQGATIPLDSVDDEGTLDVATITQLQDQEILRIGARQDFQLDPSNEELRAFAVKDFIPEPTPPTTPAPAVTPTTEVTGTATITPSTPTATRTWTPGPPTQTPTRTATLPPVPGGQQTAEATYKRQLEVIDNSPAPSRNEPACAQGCPDLSEQDYLTLIVEPRYLQEKVTEKVATDVLTETEQIRAQHILTTSREAAVKVIEMLDKGADFSKTANEQSKEQIDNVASGRPANGGDLGWFPREGSNYVTEFVEGAWPVPAGQYTKQPVQSTFGWHVIKVLERDPKRALTESEITTAKTNAYQKWFDGKKAVATLNPAPPSTPVPPTQPPIVEPTSPPVETTPTETTPGTPSPGAAGTTTTGAAPSGTATGTTGGAASPATGTTPTAQATP